MSGSSRYTGKARDTTQALSEMTDEGLFERVAMAVLRIAEPLCATLSHPGVNAEGKTRKAPLDGIGFVRGADPPHLVAVHHTTTAADGLENKPKSGSWMIARWRRIGGNCRDGDRNDEFGGSPGG